VGRSLVQLEILPRSADGPAKDNPWPEWPKVYKLDYGQEEAAAKFGGDPRVYLTTATKFAGDVDGHVKEVHTVEIEWAKNDKGQFTPKNVPGSEKVRPAQLVLLAMGSWTGTTAAGTARYRAGRAFQREGRLRQIRDERQGVFAAGDARRGQSLVVWAFNEGTRRGARVRPVFDGADGFALRRFG